MDFVLTLPRVEFSLTAADFFARHQYAILRLQRRLNRAGGEIGIGGLGDGATNDQHRCA